MTQAKRLGLGDEHRTHALGQHMPNQLQLFQLAGALQLLLQLVGFVEVVSHRMLVAIGDEHQRVATRLDCFIHRVLDQRPVNDRQHLLGNGLGRGQKSRPEACHWKYRLFDTTAHQ
ncbi:hypothetical protein D3C81_1205720 [compost metagenome]